MAKSGQYISTRSQPLHSPECDYMRRVIALGVKGETTEPELWLDRTPRKNRKPCSARRQWKRDLWPPQDPPTWGVKDTPQSTESMTVEVRGGCDGDHLWR